MKISAKTLGIVAMITAIWTASAYAQGSPQWSAAGNLGSVLNTPSTDGCSFIAKNELSLYFASNRPGGFGGLDIYVSQRFSIYDSWGVPQNLGRGINGSANELCPMLTGDGRQLFFVSDRSGGCGGQDLYVARRQSTFDDFTWDTPVGLGCDVNSTSSDFTPSLFADDGAGPAVLFFSSDRPGGSGGTDIYSSTLDAHGVFGHAVPVLELNTPADDQRPNVRNDGLEIFFDSNRVGSINGSSDLWTSTRTDPSKAWSQPVNLGPAVNTPAAEGRPSLSFDGKTLYFMSASPGGFGGQDLYITVRTDRIAAPVVTSLTVDTSTVPAGGGFKSTVSGNNLTFTTFFDVQFRMPSASADEFAWNWQTGASAQHAIPITSPIGQWIITGIRAHQDAADHSGSFVPVAVTVLVSSF
jgi:Tol biopolymer transport system component